MGKSALYLWCTGFALITFDLILTLEVSGFTIKCYYFLFLAAATLLAAEEIKSKQLWRSAELFFRPPWIFALLLFVYELGMSPFSGVPKKSFAYSAWLLFDIVVVAVPGYLLLTRKRLFGWRTVSRALLAATVSLVSVLLIDLIAFQYGYIGGLIGYNQELSLMWGMSRAHAFSFEPSYLSLFFTLVLFFFLGQFISPQRYLKRSSLAFGGFCLLVGIFLLGSRTGWLLAALGIAAILASAGRRLLKKEFLLSGVAILVAISCVLWLIPGKQISLMKQNLVFTLMKGSDGSSNTRLRAIADAITIGKESHGLGVGVGASFFYYIGQHPEVITPYLNTSQGSENIMSTWGQILAESGLPGLVLYAGFAVAMIYALFLAWRAQPQGPALSSLVACLLFFLLAAHLVGNVARTDMWVWFALWMAAAAPREREKV